MTSTQQSGCLESKIEISREDLERMREIQRNSFNAHKTKTDKGIGMLIDKYIKEGKQRYRSTYLRNSEYMQEKGLNVSTITNCIRGSNFFHLRDMKGLVDELEISKEHLHYVAGRNPFEPTEEELEEWSRDKKGLKELFEFYIDLRHASSMLTYFNVQSDYMKNIKLHPNTVRDYWLAGKSMIPIEHLKNLAEELDIPHDYVKKVSGIDIGNIRKRKLEGLREIQENSERKGDRGIALLLDLYIKERKLNRTEYLEEHSDHYRSIVFEATTVRNWFNGNNPFPLKHLKGFVDELEVDRGELEYVAGRNPFKPTEEELEEWSEDEGGVGRLLSFYIGLNHAMPVTHYIKNVSRPVTQDGLSWNTVQSWFTGTNPFRLKHLKWLVGDLNVPKMELEKVYGRDPFTLTDQDLDAFSREKGKVGKLFDFYINLNYGLFRIPYLKKSSDYLKSQGLNWGTVNTWCNGNVSFLPKHLKGFAEELGIPPDYVKRVTGVDIGGVVTAKEELDAAFVGYLAND